MGVPTVSIASVSSPRSDALTSINIIFSEAVTGFNLADLTLTRGASGNLLSGSQTLTTANNITFTLNGLSSITRQLGAYTLTLTAAGSGIVSVSTGQALVTGATRTWTMQVLAWDGVTRCFRSAHMFHQSILSTANGGALAPLAINSVTNSAGKFLVTLFASPADVGQDYRTDDVVTIEGITGAPSAAGTWPITMTASNKFTLQGPSYAAPDGSGGNAYRWHPGRWDALGSFTINAASKRGNQNGTYLISGNDTNFFVPYNSPSVIDGTYKVTDAAKGTDYGTLSTVSPDCTFPSLCFR